MKINKTNAMRALDSAALPYAVHAYPHGKEAVDGAEVARLLGQDPDAVFKTLITQANTGEYLVFMLPVNAVLDLKKAAKAAGVKHTEMIHVKDITKVSGYVRGGCSPLAMKKTYRTFIEESALLFDTICFSGGKIGVQIEMDPNALIALIHITPCDLTQSLS